MNHQAGRAERPTTRGPILIGIGVVLGFLAGFFENIENILKVGTLTLRSPVPVAVDSASQ
jgi:hypothetical protein